MVSISMQQALPPWQLCSDSLYFSRYSCLAQARQTTPPTPEWVPRWYHAGTAPTPPKPAAAMQEWPLLWAFRRAFITRASGERGISLVPQTVSDLQRADGKKKMDPKACICPFRSVALICWRGELAPWPDHLGLLQGKKSPPGFEKPLTVQNFPPALFLRTCNRIITNYRACPNAPVLHKDVKCGKISGVLGFNLVNTILSREIISSVCRLR